LARRAVALANRIPDDNRDKPDDKADEMIDSRARPAGWLVGDDIARVFRYRTAAETVPSTIYVLAHMFSFYFTGRNQDGWPAKRAAAWRPAA
jgi:hypothetical protein